MSQETLRHWLVEAGIWLPKAQAPPLSEPAASTDRLGAVFEYLEQFKAEQKTKRQKQNRKAAFRRELTALANSIPAAQR